jgi:hypothetical protein
VLLEFHQAIAAEINAVSAQIAAHEQQLEAEEDREQSGRLRIKLLLCRRHRERLEEIKRQLPLPLDAAIEDAVSRFDRWYAASAELEAAEAEMSRLEPLILRSRNAAIAPENAVQKAQEQLDEFLRRPADRLASGAEISKRREQEAELRTKVAGAHQKMRHAVQERDRHENELVGARQRRDAASFKTRMLLSPEIVASLEEAHAGAAT